MRPVCIIAHHAVCIAVHAINLNKHCMCSATLHAPCIYRPAASTVCSLSRMVPIASTCSSSRSKMKAASYLDHVSQPRLVLNSTSGIRRALLSVVQRLLLALNSRQPQNCPGCSPGSVRAVAALLVHAQGQLTSAHLAACRGHAPGSIPAGTVPTEQCISVSWAVMPTSHAVHTAHAVVASNQ